MMQGLKTRFAALVGASGLMACAHAAPTASLAPVPPAAPTLVELLADSADPYARRHGDLVGRAVEDTERDLGAMDGRCGNEARLLVGQLETRLGLNPAAARYGIHAAAEIRRRARRCSIDPCHVVDTEAGAVAVVDGWLKISAQTREAGLDATARAAVVAWRHAEAEEWSQSAEAWRAVAEASGTCAWSQADAQVHWAEAAVRAAESPDDRDRVLAALHALESRLDEDQFPGLVGLVHLRIGYWHAYQQDYEAALRHHLAAADSHEREGRAGVVDRLTALNAAAVALGSLRRSAEALEMNETVLRGRTAILGDGHPDSLISQSNIAFMQTGLGRDDKALEAHYRLLALRTELYGPDSEDLPVTLDAIGFTLARQGHPAEAVPYCERSIAIRERDLSLRDPDRPYGHACLALALLGVGDAQGARRESARAVEQARSTFGSHPVTARWLRLEARVARETGDEARAADLSAEADEMTAERNSTR